VPPREGYAVNSALEPDCRGTSMWSQREWLFTVGYADDIAIPINGKFNQTVLEVL
jgi:hypothetical protein